MATNVFPDGDESYDFLFKLVLVGDPGVGKTCVVQRYKHGVFTERQANTIGVDFTLKTIDVDGKRVKVSSSIAEGDTVSYTLRFKLEFAHYFCCRIVRPGSVGLRV